MEQNVKQNPFKAILRALRTIMFFWISGQPRKHKFDAWTVGLISFFAIGSTILITDAFKPLNPSLKTKEAEIAATCPLLDLTDNSEICVLNKGEKVEVLAYTTSYFQVQTEKGERGWVYMTAFGNEMVVEELDNKAGLEVGSICTYVQMSPDNKYKFLVKDSDGNIHTLSNGDVVPVSSFGVNSVVYETTTEKPYIYVTTRWMKKHFKEGMKLDKLMKTYYGNARSIDIREDGSKVVIFPLHVKEYWQRNEFETVKAKFQNDVLVSYDLKDPCKLQFVEKWIPFAERIASSRLYIKLRSHSYVIKPKYNDIDDLIKKNQESKNIAKVLKVTIIAFLVWLCWLTLNSHIMFLAAIMSLTHRFKWLSNNVYEGLMFYSSVIYLVLLYLLYLPYWMIIVLALFIFYGFGLQLSNWVTYSRCENCKEMHTLETVGWSEPKHYSYDEYIEHTTKEAGSNRTLRSWTERRRHHVTVQIEYLKCQKCGHDEEITHTSDRVE